MYKRQRSEVVAEVSWNGEAIVNTTTACQNTTAAAAATAALFSELSRNDESANSTAGHSTAAPAAKFSRSVGRTTISTVDHTEADVAKCSLTGESTIGTTMACRNRAVAAAAVSSEAWRDGAFATLAEYRNKDKAAVSKLSQSGESVIDTRTACLNTALVVSKLSKRNGASPIAEAEDRGTALAGHHKPSYCTPRKPKNRQGRWKRGNALTHEARNQF